MNFAAQVRRALGWGVGAGLAGVLLAFVSVLLEARGYRLMSGVTGMATMGLIAGGAMLGLAGGVVRPAQRRMFRHGMPSGRLRGLMLRRPALRWWLWVDGNGRDRDVG